MNNRERALAILHYQETDRVPVVHFGFWNETLDKWVLEGHVTAEEAAGWGDGNEIDFAIGRRLGFDYNAYTNFHWAHSLKPFFERKVVRVREDGTREFSNEDGVVVMQKDEAGSIPAEIEHLLTNRKSWEEHYLQRLQWSDDRIDFDALAKVPAKTERNRPWGIYCGSLLGRIRDMTGVVGLSYLISDDPGLVDEMIEVTADICYTGVKKVLEKRDDFDFGHFWEDICYNRGPLVNPKFFDEKIGPHYKRITDLLLQHGIDICSLDCDGKIDRLIPTWLKNGVNTMFPMEVGTWAASIQPWREQYGQQIRGIGGMNKVVFARDYAAIDAEVERLKPLVALGGYIPCVDHRIPPDARWENIQYFCDRMHAVFG